MESKTGRRNKMIHLATLLLGTIVLGLVFVCFLPFDADAYVVVHTESGRYPDTPQEAEDSKVDFRDAFIFPGNFGGIATDYQANHAYLSRERSNVVIVYDGVVQSQKSSVWYGSKLNLNQTFEFEYYVFLSNKEKLQTNGLGDGITFVMQNDPAGQNAIGGRGGGIGTYPMDLQTANMIYNALALEFDTYNNDSISVPNYDAELKSISSVVWPHVALGTTSTINQHSFNNASIQEVYNNFTHRAITIPQSRTEGDSWFGEWKKVSVKWEPQADGINGLYTYQFADYPPQSQLINIDATFQNVWGGSASTRPAWDRKVTWGFVGSNYLAGNAFGVMITKLPQQPILEVERLVRNVTAGEIIFKKATIAKNGDHLEYKVDVLNQVTEESDIVLKKAKVVEALEGNQYVNGSMTFSNTMSSTGATTPQVLIDNENNFTFIDNKYEYGQGQGFQYKYLVKVGEDTTDFVNSVGVSSIYSTEENYGETTVTINPEELSMVKKVENSNPTVNEEITLTLETTVEKGQFMVSQIQDTLPDGLELLPNTTKVYNKGQSSTAISLDDAMVWSGQQLTITRNDKERFAVNGGAIHQNTLIVEYKVRPLESVKGRLVDLQQASIAGTNNYRESNDKAEYSTTSNTTDLTVKTDVIIEFRDNVGTLLDKSLISSTDAKYNEKNPVTLYFNTGDAYDLTSEIQAISQKILTNHSLSQKKIEGEVTSKAIPENGHKIVVTYSSDATITIKFVDEKDQDIVPAVIKPVSIGDELDLTTESDVLDKLKEAKESYYDLVSRPSDEEALMISASQMEVKYLFAGKLTLVSIPTSLDFGMKNIGNGEKIRENKPTYQEPLVIADTRADRTKGWTLKAALSKPLTSEDSTVVIPDAIRYKKPSENEFVLDNNTQILLASDKGDSGTFDISATWGNQQDSDGFKIEIPAVKVRQLGKYQATIIYYLADTYEP